MNQNPMYPGETVLDGGYQALTTGFDPRHQLFQDSYKDSLAGGIQRSTMGQLPGQSNGLSVDFGPQTNDLGGLQTELGQLDPGGLTKAPGFMERMGGFKGIGSLLSGVASIGGLYNSYQANKLAKRQFSASLADRNQNIANLAKTTNLQLDNQNSMAGQMFGNAPGSQGLTDYRENNLVQVDGSPIHA